MKNFLKSIYISAYITLLSLAAVHSIVGLNEDGFNSAWPAILLATAPSLLFFVRLFVKPVARTSSNLPFMMVFAVIGTVLALALASNSEQTLFAWVYGVGLSIFGSVLYIFWYSNLSRGKSSQLELGKVLPEFSLSSAQGEQWSSSQQLNKPALFIFFRGNWCPLCLAQIREIAEYYQQLDTMGVNVYLVSPQPDTHTKALAEKFQVNFNFMVDEGNQAAKVLGIDAKHGTPKGMEVLGYDSDTVLPTAILVDAEQRIIMADETNNYRVRPEPETFIQAFLAAGIGSESRDNHA